MLAPIEAGNIDTLAGKTLLVPYSRGDSVLAIMSALLGTTT